MKKITPSIKTDHLRSRAFVFVCAMLLALAPFFSLITLVRNVGAAQTSESYCSQYTSGGNLNACYDGILNKDCSDYVITHNQATADICTQSQHAKASGLITDTPETTAGVGGSTDAQVYKNIITSACAPYSGDKSAASWCLYGGMGEGGTEGKPKNPQDCFSKPELQSSTTNQGACVAGATAGQAFNAAKTGETGVDFGNNGSNGDSANAIQDLLDQVKSLSDYIDKLHALGPNAGINTAKESDNNYGSYVNGAGKQQPIRVYPCTSAIASSCPAIVSINGGGWHSDDGVSQLVAEGASHKNVGREIGPPVGGGANARGYTVIEITYRLGSSGIYYMLEDVMRGIRHVRNNSKLYGIDPNKMAIMGDSAGGSLAMRAGATGQTGARAMVGWSAPTNGYTALFKSYKTLLIGMDHSTCIPTDIAGAMNTTSLLTGGKGNVVEYGQGITSNDFSGLGIDGGSGASAYANPLDTLMQVLTAAQYASQTSQNVESITQQLTGGSPQSLAGGLINLSANKLGECLDNFNVMSPALYASASSPAGFLAGFDSDDVVDPQQAYDMRDKLLSLGVRAEALILQGNPDASGNFLGVTENHLGYDPRFLCPTLNFLDSVMTTGRNPIDCTDPASIATELSGGSSSGSIDSAITNNSNGSSSSYGGSSTGSGSGTSGIGGLGGGSGLGGLGNIIGTGGDNSVNPSKNTPSNSGYVDCGSYYRVVTADGKTICHPGVSTFSYGSPGCPTGYKPTTITNNFDGLSPNGVPACVKVG